MKLINDLKCIALQKMVFAKLNPGKKPNSFEPRNPPAELKREDGIIIRSDLCYGTKYPNSYFDLWFLEENRDKKCPVLVYFHGGGFLFGDKTMGDPLAVGQGGDNDFCAMMAKRGYKVVNGNYALAPKYCFPVPVEQVGQLLAHLQENEENYALDMERIFLSGGSAGADMAELYGTVLTCPAFAAELGLQPTVRAEQVIGLIIDEAALSPSDDKNLNVLMGCAYGVSRKQAPKIIAHYDPTVWIKDRYIPSFINASNEQADFGISARALAAVLERNETDYDYFIPGPEDGMKKHGYMKDHATDPCSKVCLDRMLAFMDRQLARKEAQENAQ